MSEQLFIMEGNGEVNIYNGNYSEYRLSLEQLKEKAEKKIASAPTAVKDNTKKLSYKEQKELEDSEAEIAVIEDKILSLTSSLAAIDSSNYLEIEKVSGEIQSLNNKLDLVMQRWLELSEKVN